MALLPNVNLAHNKAHKNPTLSQLFKGLKIPALNLPSAANEYIITINAF